MPASYSFAVMPQKALLLKISDHARSAPEFVAEDVGT
jgi:hypothetical protein